MIRAFGFSDPGSVRQTNEDSFVVDPELNLFVVADGMGGHAAGELASRLAVESIENFIRRSRGATDFSWPCGIDPKLTYDANRLKTSIHLANRRVFRVAESHDDYTGTTVVSAVVTGPHMVVGHVGDSRLYLLEDGKVSQLTRDDSWAATVMGGADPEAMKHHPMRHVLTNVLGARDQTEIHVAERDLKGGELLLLCSDGLHNVLNEAALVELMTGDDLEAMAKRLVLAAIERGSRDNVTALVVHYTRDAE
jgi:serine/threonine protein phosphatase PrpC